MKYFFPGNKREAHKTQEADERIVYEAYKAQEAHRVVGLMKSFPSIYKQSPVTGGGVISGIELLSGTICALC